MSFPITRRRTVLALLAVLMGVTAMSDAPRAQALLRFDLEWDHAGPEPAYFDVCVDGRCQLLTARRMGGTTWRAPLPHLTLGEHHLVVRACGAGTCVPGTPDLFVRVVRPNAKTPPLQVR